MTFKYLQNHTQTLGSESAFKTAVTEPKARNIPQKYENFFSPTKSPAPFHPNFAQGKEGKEKGVKFWSGLFELVQGGKVYGVVRRDVCLTVQEHRHIDWGIDYRTIYTQIVAGKDKRLPDIKLTALQDI